MKYYIQLDNLATKMDDHYWELPDGRWQVFNHVMSSSATISPVDIGGKRFYQLGYGGEWSKGCKIEGRWSSINPLYRLNAKNDDSIYCSDPSKPGETNRITISTTSSYKGDILSLTSTMRDEQRQPFEWMGKHSIIGTNYEARVELSLSVKDGACKVLKANLTAKSKAIHNKNFSNTRTTSFSSKCTVQ